MPPDRARLYLHIGRNKAGSTTLQGFCLDHVEPLRRAGVQYALFGYPSPPGAGVPSFASHTALIDFVRAQDGGAVLVSHEGLCCFLPEFARAMAQDLSALDVRVIFYVRPYRAWVVSSYGFDVRAGFNACDFDAYLADLAPSVSFRPALEIWGEALGWDRVRVRSLHPADLVTGELVGDFMAAIGVDLSPGRGSERLNTGAHWMALELIRALKAGDATVGWPPGRLGLAEAVHQSVDIALQQRAARFVDAPYLTRAQAQRLATLYNADLAFVAERTGVALQRDDAAGAPERAFLPSAERAPASILDFVRARVPEAALPAPARP